MEKLYCQTNWPQQNIELKNFIPELFSLETGLEEVIKTGDDTICAMCQTLLKSGGKDCVLFL